MRNTLKKLDVPQTYSGVGMTAAAMGGTIDQIGPIPYAGALALGVFNILVPANPEEKNPIIKTLRKAETASHLMMAGAGYNAIENCIDSVQTGNPANIALTAYWSLAAAAHFKMGELQRQGNNAKQSTPKNTFEAIAKNPANIFIPMNLILATLPLMMNGSLPTSVTAVVALACTLAGGAHVVKKTGQALRGEIENSAVNDGVVNKFNMGVCGANAIGFMSVAIANQDLSALAMAVASTAFVGTNWKLKRMFAPKPKPQGQEPA